MSVELRLDARRNAEPEIAERDDGGVAAARLKRLDIRPIVRPEITRTHAIVRRRNRVVTKAILAIGLAVRDAIARLVDQGIFPDRYIARPAVEALSREPSCP